MPRTRTLFPALFLFRFLCSEVKPLNSPRHLSTSCLMQTINQLPQRYQSSSRFPKNRPSGAASVCVAELNGIKLQVPRCLTTTTRWIGCVLSFATFSLPVISSQLTRPNCLMDEIWSFFIRPSNFKVRFIGRGTGSTCTLPRP